MEVLRLNGTSAREYVKELAELRLKVFYDYPYLYEGSFDYEVNYLETYFKAQHSLIVILKDQNKVVGATTAIWAKEEEKSFREPFEKAGLDTNEVFYFGESVLLKEYRGQGWGKVFMEERERFARDLRFIKILSFCSVERGEHPLRPEGYKPLDGFWMSCGFKKAHGLKTEYHWKDRGDVKETNKLMQYWIKEIL